MQEEVTQKTVALSIQTAKLTADVLQKAVRKLLAAKKNKSHELHRGKQTMKQLMRHNTGVSNIEVTKDNIKAFESTAKKYGIDFAVKKDISVSPPRYLVFFKSRDADVLTAAFKEFSARNLAKEKKPSIRKLLKTMKEKVQQKTRQREKVKTRERGVEL
ncbi:MAG: PcfB family protein [Lachnospiraceae bacterium]|nr:PcfB family protein [Lachnospiraceae bacterium]